MLVAAPARWDEMCFSVPAVRALVASGTPVGVLCDMRQHEIWKALGITSLIPYSEKANAKALAAELGGGWDAAIVWEPGVAAEAIARASIPKRLGPEVKELKKLLTHPVDLSKPPGPIEHRVTYYLSLVGKLGMNIGRQELFSPILYNVSPAKNAVLLAPDSDHGAIYEWPLERWIELGNALLAQDIRLTVAGLPGGRDLGAKLAVALGEKVRCMEAEPMAGAMELLAIHQVLVAADSSLVHLGSLAGTTCITLFGPGNPTLRRPLGKRHAIARRDVECSPCMLTKCLMDMRCQNELTVDEVLAMVRNKLAPASAA